MSKLGLSDPVDILPPPPWSGAANVLEAQEAAFWEGQAVQHAPVLGAIPYSLKTLYDNFWRTKTGAWQRRPPGMVAAGSGILESSPSVEELLRIDATEAYYLDEEGDDAYPYTLGGARGKERTRKRHAWFRAKHDAEDISSPCWRLHEWDRMGVPLAQIYEGNLSGS